LRRYGVGIRFEARNQSTRSSAAKSYAGGEQFLDLEVGSSNNSFNVELEFMKLLPKGPETDFVLVSCGGAGMPEGEVGRSRLSDEPRVESAVVWNYAVVTEI